MKKIDSIPFTEIHSIPLQINDFLQGELVDFKEDLFSLDNFSKKIEQKQDQYSEANHAILCNVLEEQMKDLDLSETQKKNLELLKFKSTFTITTGHQLNLFSGPVFFVYKILQTIKTAFFLKEKFPKNNFVPIFWMATEDHDFQEINHFKAQEKTYFINEKEGGAVGRILISDTDFISEFEGDFKETKFGESLINLIKSSYKKGKTLAEATRILVHQLFAEYGILILDGDDVGLKQLAIPIFKDELRFQTLHRETEEKVNFLTKKYGKVQVNPRTINLFYLAETRNRIDWDGENYQIIDTNQKFTPEELLAELEKHPEKFSPNALMRPVYQETVLPNIAYVGGNAEIMYWMELKDYFDKISLPFPVLFPRNSMLFIQKKTLNKIEKLNLSVKDFFSDFQKFTIEILLQNNEILRTLKLEEKTIEESFKKLQDISEKTDISFGNLVNAEKARQLKSFQRMQKRLLRAEKKKNTEKIERLNNLYYEVHPNRIWQERVFNFSIFYADLGENWLKNCLKEMPVQHSELIVMEI